MRRVQAFPNISCARRVSGSQRVQDNIVEWVKQDNWQRIVAEKRSVLACMHQVLESCHTLLDSTHIPVDGIVRLLQHILRCAERCHPAAPLLNARGIRGSDNAGERPRLFMGVCGTAPADGGEGVWQYGASIC